MPDEARQTTPAAAAGAAITPRAVRPAGRQIRGRTLAERRQDRRDAMLVAGLDLFGTKGVAHTRVEEVCRRAGVSTRNFYEEFDDRHSLLVAIGEQIVAGVFAVWSSPAAGPGGRGAIDDVTATLRTRVANVVHLLVDDPRVARLAFVEAVGVSPHDEVLRREMLRVFPTWLEAYMRGRLDAAGVPAGRQRTMAAAAFATGHELVADWALSPPEERSDVDALVDDVLAMGAAIYGVRSPLDDR
jgi:AcrR family transcriptional regulator